jgi:glycosyltransferase involved in cell wall biosynthesis
VSVSPRVSVTIPAYNSAPYLARTLESLLQQTYTNLEIIVVDDGSTDDTERVLAPYLGRIVYHRQQNGGLPVARNKGFELANGELIAWMDSDDLCEPERLAVQAAYLAQNPHVAAIGSEFSAIDENDRLFDVAHSSTYYSEFARHGAAGLFSKRELFAGIGLTGHGDLSRSYEVYSGDVWRRLVFGNFMHPPTMMMRRSAVEQAGELRTDVTSAEDWEYITRLSRVGHIAFIDAPLLRYRRHPGQMSLNKAAASTLSRITVLQETRERHRADLVGLDAEIRRQLVEFHQEAAYMHADINAAIALSHLAKAFLLDPQSTRFMFHLARIAMPTAGMMWLRKLRAR